MLTRAPGLIRTVCQRQLLPRMRSSASPLDLPLGSALCLTLGLPLWVVLQGLLGIVHYNGLGFMPGTRMTLLPFVLPPQTATLVFLARQAGAPSFIFPGLVSGHAHFGCSGLPGIRRLAVLLVAYSPISGTSGCVVDRLACVSFA